MKKIIVLATLFALLFGQLEAQTADDALRYSQSFYEGSARNIAMGSSFSVLGADFSAAAINPAGLGLYRGYEFSISPELAIRNSNSVYNGVLNSDSRTVFNLSGFSYVMAQKVFSAKKNDWKFVQFSLGMNRLNNFNTRLNMAGPNNFNSRIDAYLQQANGIPYKQIEDDIYGDYAFDLNPAWNLYLIDTIPGTDNLYYSPVPPGGIFQRETISSKGSINEYSFSFSANYNDFVYLGATVGMPYIRYFSTSVFRETDIADTIPTFNEWSITQDLATTGWGINLKVGVIIRPANWIRLGAAVHTPTYFYSMRDTWSTTTYADLPGLDPSYVTSPVGNFNYNITTPFKAIGSAGFIIKKQGLISLEYEFTDYSTARITAPGTDYSVDNGDIKHYYGPAHNLRAGAEWRFGPLSLRGGYAYYGSPYKNNFNDASRKSVTAGMGYSTGKFIIDLAYVHTTYSEDYYMYSLSSGNTFNENMYVAPVNNSFKENRFVTTVKFRF